MASTLLERGIRISHLTTVADRAGHYSFGNGDIDLLGLQDAQEAEVGGAG